MCHPVFIFEARVKIPLQTRLKFVHDVLRWSFCKMFRKHKRTIERKAISTADDKIRSMKKGRQNTSTSDYPWICVSINLLTWCMRFYNKDWVTRSVKVENLCPSCLLIWMSLFLLECCTRSSSVVTSVSLYFKNSIEKGCVERWGNNMHDSMTAFKERERQE